MDIYPLLIYINNKHEDFYLQFQAQHTSWYPASAVDLVGNQLHMHDPVLCEFSTQQVGFSIDFN